MIGRETRRVEIEIVGRATIPMTKVTAYSFVGSYSFKRILVEELLIEDVPRLVHLTSILWKIHNSEIEVGQLYPLIRNGKRRLSKHYRNCTNQCPLTSRVTTDKALMMGIINIRNRQETIAWRGKRQIPNKEKDSCSKRKKGDIILGMNTQEKKSI